ATANLGAVGLKISNGVATFHAAGSFSLADPGAGASKDGRISLDELTDVVRDLLKDPADTTDYAKLVTNSKLSGTAHVDLPVSLRAPLAGVTLPSDAKITVDWTNVADPTTLSLKVDPRIDLKGLTISLAMQGLQAGRDFLAKELQSAIFQQKIPLLNKSLADLASVTAKLDAAIDDLRRNPPQTLDELAQRLAALVPSSGSLFSFSNKTLDLNLAYAFKDSLGVHLSYDVSPALGKFID
ncbi:PspA/IM30 family protein, partial [Singulisphaera rosea]